MSVSTPQNQRSRYGSNDVGKSICISFGLHELGLIEDLDRLAHSEGVNRSQWIRRKILEEKVKLKEQESAVMDWSALVGDK